MVTESTTPLILMRNPVGFFHLRGVSCTNIQYNICKSTFLKNKKRSHRRILYAMETPAFTALIFQLLNLLILIIKIIMCFVRCISK